MANDTLFDRILAKTIPADIVYEDDDILAFRDIHPQAPTHVLVIPKVKAARFSDFAQADPAVVGTYLVQIARVAAHLDLEESGYRVVFNCGHNGQQTVEYVHAHILGGRAMHWPPG